MSNLFTGVLSIFNTFFRGWLIKMLWAWFIVSQFPSLPQLSTLAAIGLSMFVSAVSPWKSFSAAELEEADKPYRQFPIRLLNQLVLTIVILLSLGFGWLVHHFM